MQHLIALYFTTQTSYPRTQEFRNEVTQKESRMSLNCHKYSFIHPEQAEKWHLYACKSAVLIKQAGNHCTALKN